MIFDKLLPTSSAEMEMIEREEQEAQERAGREAMTSHVVNPDLENTLDIDALAAERMLDMKWLARLMTIQPHEFGKLSPTERRVFADRAERFHKRFEGISNWMNMNAGRAPLIPEMYLEGSEVPMLMRRQAQ